MRERGRSDDGNDKLRITAQFRTREGMAYELREHGARLTVMITAGTQSEGAWLVEAFSSLEPTSGIQNIAATRREALRRTGAAWRVEAGNRGLPQFDWDAVADALTTVRAI